MFRHFGIGDALYVGENEALLKGILKKLVKYNIEIYIWVAKIIFTLISCYPK